MMRSFLRLLLMLLFTVFLAGCGSPEDGSAASKNEDPSSTVKKLRDDGTLSSVNPVDEEGYVHGVKVNYYEDGKTVHSRITYDHGRKHGPALWYYKNGQVYEHTNFHYGQKQGLTRKYYDTGELMEELAYEQGEELPGKKTFNKQGALISE
jgi:antitoxin component YwqK of YwqJK toxin-antitoxin module